MLINEKIRGLRLISDVAKSETFSPLSFYDKDKRIIIELDANKDYHLGNSDRLNLVPNMLIKSENKDTTIRSSIAFSTGAKEDQGNAINLNHNSGFENVTIQSDAPYGVEQTLIGFDSRFKYNQNKRIAFLNNIKVIGSSWAIYLWPSGDANVYLIMRTCEVYSGRQCVSACGSNTNSQFIDIYNSILKIKPELKTAGGAISEGCFALVARGGRIRAYNLITHVIGDPTAHLNNKPSRAASVTDAYYTSGEYATIELYNLISKVDGNGAEEVFDIDQRRGTIINRGGFGSGPNGKLIINGKVD